MCNLILDSVSRRNKTPLLSRVQYVCGDCSAYRSGFERSLKPCSKMPVATGTLSESTWSYIPILRVVVAAWITSREIPFPYCQNVTFIVRERQFYFKYSIVRKRHTSLPTIQHHDFGIAPCAMFSNRRSALGSITAA
jgi:hypothetical protein